MVESRTQTSSFKAALVNYVAKDDPNGLLAIFCDFWKNKICSAQAMADFKVISDEVKAEAVKMYKDPLYQNFPAKSHPIAWNNELLRGFDQGGQPEMCTLGENWIVSLKEPNAKTVLALLHGRDSWHTF